MRLAFGPGLLLSPFAILLLVAAALIGASPSGWGYAVGGVLVSAGGSRSVGGGGRDSPGRGSPCSCSRGHFAFLDRPEACEQAITTWLFDQERQTHP